VGNNRGARKLARTPHVNKKKKKRKKVFVSSFLTNKPSMWVFVIIIFGYGLGLHVDVDQLFFFKKSK